MKKRNLNLAAVPAIGTLILILVASAFAELVHEEHLPEKNGRGGYYTSTVSGFLVGILILLATVPGFGRSLHRFRNSHSTSQHPGHSPIPAIQTDFIMRCPMRMQYS